MDMEFRSDPTVELVDSMGTDDSVVAAARVSVNGDEATPANEAVGLINYLMSHRHGTPFEHATVKFRIEAPIFVFREFHRHRVGWSYNEMSGRYTELKPVFHVPAADRPLVNVGTSARPKMVPGTEEQYDLLVETLTTSYRIAFTDYLHLMEKGVAKEVAREVLPVGIYSQMYATANMRSLMHFLSLRTHDEQAAIVSHPQYEIEQVARAMEDVFRDLWPLTYDSWNDNGRQAP